MHAPLGGAKLAADRRQFPLVLPFSAAPSKGWESRKNGKQEQNVIMSARRALAERESRPRTAPASARSLRALGSRERVRRGLEPPAVDNEPWYSTNAPLSLRLYSQRDVAAHRLSHDRPGEADLGCQSAPTCTESQWFLAQPSPMLRTPGGLRLARQRFELSSKISLKREKNGKAAIGPMISAGTATAFRMQLLDCGPGDLSLQVSVVQIGHDWYATGGGLCLWVNQHLNVREDADLHENGRLAQTASMLPKTAAGLRCGEECEIRVDLRTGELRCGKEVVRFSQAITREAVPIIEIGMLSDATSATLLLTPCLKDEKT